MYRIVAIAPSGARKIVSETRNAFKATWIASQVRLKGFKVEVTQV